MRCATCKRLEEEGPKYVLVRVYESGDGRLARPVINLGDVVPMDHDAYHVYDLVMFTSLPLILASFISRSFGNKEEALSYARDHPEVVIGKRIALD